MIFKQVWKFIFHLFNRVRPFQDFVRLKSKLYLYDKPEHGNTIFHIYFI